MVASTTPIVPGDLRQAIVARDIQMRNEGEEMPPTVEVVCEFRLNKSHK
jgi:hypothetical protein